jgi:hypothetical protein
MQLVVQLVMIFYVVHFPGGHSQIFLTHTPISKCSPHAVTTVTTKSEGNPRESVTSSSCNRQAKIMPLLFPLWESPKTQREASTFTPFFALQL